MTARRLRLGIVGAGAIASAYVEAAMTAPSIQISAVADIDSGASERLAAAAGCPCFSSVKALAGSGLVDAALVATPPATHEDVTTALVKRRIHVLCEKPFAISAESALRMIAAADASDTMLTMASKFRYVNDVTRARDMIAAGNLGRPLMLENSFTTSIDMSNRWNANPAVAGGGVLIDNGTHSVDIARFLFGPVVSVLAVVGPSLQSLAVEDNAQLFLRTDTGALGRIDLSWSVAKHQPTFIGAYGTDGAIRIGWARSEYRTGTDGEWTPFGTGYDKLTALRSQLENFAVAIRGTRPLDITAIDAFASVEVIDAAYRSIDADRWVRVDDRLASTAVAVASGRAGLSPIP